MRQSLSTSVLHKESWNRTWGSYDWGFGFYILTLRRIFSTFWMFSDWLTLYDGSCNLHQAWHLDCIAQVLPFHLFVDLWTWTTQLELSYEDLESLVDWLYFRIKIASKVHHQFGFCGKGCPRKSPIVASGSEKELMGKNGIVIFWQTSATNYSARDIGWFSRYSGFFAILHLFLVCPWQLLYNYGAYRC